jgi:uncharacterized protein (DUF433 family)
VIDKQYVEKREGGYYLSQTCISLAWVVYAYLDGHSAEGIQKCYPLLTLERIHGALAFYLGHRAEVDADLAAKLPATSTPAFYEHA